MKKRKRIPLTVLLGAFILLFFTTAVTGLEAGRQAEGKKQLEDVLRRTAATCYASEGFYPPDLDYMRKYYGLRYDEKQYHVYYEIFASNLMPEITVLEK